MVLGETHMLTIEGTLHCLSSLSNVRRFLKGGISESSRNNICLLYSAAS